MIIEKLDHQGRGIGYLNSKITFVKNALPEEDVTLNKIISKKNYNEADILKINKISSKRIKPICPYFNECGGCDLMHLNNDDQIAFKKQKMNEIFSKYLKETIDFEFIQQDILNYRNKVSLKIKNKKIGYYSKQTNKLIEIKYCYLAKNSINDFIKDYQLLNLANAKLTIRSNYNDELLIIINSTDKININYEKLIKKHKIVGIIYNDKCIYGEDSFIEIIDKMFFKISYNSFFQINNSITREIFPKLLDNISQGDKVLDLYCGVGTLGLSIAFKIKQLYGIEIIPNAIKNALINTKMNKIDNAKFFLGKTNDVVSKLSQKFDLIIVDPPRKGLEKKDINFILENNPKQIIYMSCDPMTLVRDLNILKSNYKIEKSYLFDMFAQTYHLETLIILKIKK